jgi:hypothetical protein
MHLDALYNSVGLAVFGIALILLGRHLGSEYRRLFGGRRIEATDMAGSLAAYLGYVASLLIAAGIGFLILAAVTLGTEAWVVWRR